VTIGISIALATNTAPSPGPGVILARRPVVGTQGTPDRGQVTQDVSDLALLDDLRGRHEWGAGVLRCRAIQLLVAQAGDQFGDRRAGLFEPFERGSLVGLGLLLGFASVALVDSSGCLAGTGSPRAKAATRRAMRTCASAT
jgi:hypothetical protein